MLKVIELFAGIGAYSKALERIGVKHQVVAAIELDKKTMNCYNLIHKTKFSTKDVTEIKDNELPECDIICYSPPCQAFSVAGKQLGYEDSRGVLFFNALKIIKAKKPKIAIMENVKGLTQKKFQTVFAEMLLALEQAGYKNYWKILNSKDYGIPQNRERVFIVSINKEYNEPFEFPEQFDNGIRLKDLLEDDVEEKFYISDEKCEKLLKELRSKIEVGETLCVNTKMKETQSRNDGISFTLTATMQKEPLKVCVPVITHDKHGILVTDNKPKITEVCNTIDANYSKGIGAHQQRCGVIVIGRCEGINGHDLLKRVYSPEGISPTLNTCEGGNREPKIVSNYRIRKLTPKECIRLMGFDDSDYESLKDGRISNSHIYKICGNSIVVNVLEEIFRGLFLCQKGSV